MPFKSFDIETMDVDDTASSLIILHAAPLMRLGMKNALHMYASLSGKTIHHGARVAELADAIRAARRGAVILCDVTSWTAIERDAGGLREHIRAEGVAICLVACTDESAYRLLQLRGVSGVVTPECDGSELERAVSEIAEGRTYFKAEDRLAPTTGMAKLSSRQVEILELMTRGLLNKQIAWELGVTEGTVKSHVSAILDKLGCDRRTQAITAFLQSLGVGSQHSQRSFHA